MNIFFGIAYIFVLGILAFLILQKPYRAPGLLFFALLAAGSSLSSRISIAGVDVNLLDVVFLGTFTLTIIRFVVLKRHSTRIISFQADSKIKWILVCIALGLIMGLTLQNNFRLWGRELHVIAYGPLIYLLMVLSLKSIADMKYFLRIVLFASILAVAKMSFVGFTGTQIKETDNLWQVSSTFYTSLQGWRIIPQGADLFFIMAILFLICYLFFGSPKANLLIMITCLVVLQLGVVMTLTRSLLLAEGVGFLVMLSAILGLKKRKNLVIGLIALSAALTILYVLLPKFVLPESKFSLAQLIIRRFSFNPIEGAGGMEYRLLESKFALQTMTPIAFVIGRGFGSTYAMYNIFSWVSSYTHSGWVWVLLKMGGLGFIIYYGSLLLSARKAIRVFRDGRGLKDCFIPLAAGACLISFAVIDSIFNRTADFQGPFLIGGSFAIIDVWIKNVGNKIRKPK